MKRKMQIVCMLMLPALAIPLLLISQASARQETSQGADYPAGERWSIEKARKWYNSHDWIAGANFVPSTAVNMIEMWQAKTFDPETIDRELGWAEDIGFNTMRVYLHYLVWARSAEGYKQRINRYLEIADSHGIKTIFVLYDDVWGENPQLGPQPEPVPGVHNSGWVQCPGEDQRLDKALWPVFEAYTKDIISTYADDPRVLMWDLYNEPGNGKNPPVSTLPLLKKVFQWAREVDPSQPLTAGVWNWSEPFSKLNEFQLTHSDIITFHTYVEPELTKQRVENLRERTNGRPMICTEYMARTRNNTFQNHMPYFHQQNIGAINWGLVSGKTQTIYPWNYPRGSSDEFYRKWLNRMEASYSWEEQRKVLEPEVWFHDIFRRDGTPYDPDEIALIQKLSSLPAGGGR